jgi:hypothetical protein
MESRAPPLPDTLSSSSPRCPILQRRISLNSILSVEPYTTPLAILSASKRKLEQYESKLGDWNELFTKTGADLLEAGMTVPERRYLLWILEKYR